MIRKIGIIGSGKMGSDIFNYLSDFDFEIVWFILFEEEKEKLQKVFSKKMNRQLKHNLISEKQYNNKQNFLFTNRLSDLFQCDLIIESIPEELELKRELFKLLEHNVKDDCILTSNTSSILPEKLSDLKPVVGVHFFFPVAFKNTVELVPTHNIEDNIIREIQDFLVTIKKNEFLQNEKSAFILNRFLLDIQAYAFDIYKKSNISLNEIDKLIQKTIPDFGIFEMMDHVGLKTMFNSIKNYAQMVDEPERYNVLLDEIEKRINSNTPLVDLSTEEENSNADENILNDVKDYIQELINKYIINYDLNEHKFKEALNDFCGILY